MMKFLCSLVVVFLLFFSMTSQSATACEMAVGVCDVCGGELLPVAGIVRTSHYVLPYRQLRVHDRLGRRLQIHANRALPVVGVYAAPVLLY